MAFIEANKKENYEGESPTLSIYMPVLQVAILIVENENMIKHQMKYLTENAESLWKIKRLSRQ